MAIEAELVTVGTDPAALNAAEGPGSDRASILVRNVGPITAYVGGPDVDSSSGFPLATGASLTLDLGAGEVAAAAVVADTAAGAVTVTTDTAGGPGTNEVQSVDVDGTGGTFTLATAGDETDPIVYNVTAAALETALEELSDIGSGNVSVSGGPAPTSDLVIEFVGALAETDVDELVADDALVGSGSVNVNVIRQGVG